MIGIALRELEEAHHYTGAALRVLRRPGGLRSARILDRGAELRRIGQRDLRLRSKEIMDAVEGGQSFTVTRDGHEIGELIPLRRKRRTFVPTDELLASWKNAPHIDPDRFRADIDRGLDPYPDDPYAR